MVATSLKSISVMNILEKLFIRTGNQTVEIKKLDEKLIYLNDRFNL